MHIRPLFTLTVLATALTVLSPPASFGGASAPEPYRSGDRSLVALNILPPGQGGYMNAAEALESQGTGMPEHFTDQRELYAKLIPELNQITSANLAGFFKDASFGVAPGDVGRTYSPRAGTEIVRDKSYNVPHIYGQTRGDTMFGAGYVSAEDRLFMMDVLRHLGRGRVSELLGPSDRNLGLDCDQYEVADYTDAELTAMITDRPANSATELAAIAEQDVRDYAAGINAYIAEARLDPNKMPAEYAALQITPRDWTIADTAAVASLIGGGLGVGGGEEVENALFLNALQDQGHSPQQARAVFEDFRFADDPEAPSTTDNRFPWNDNLGPVDPGSVAIPDDAPIHNDVAVEDSCSGVRTSSSGASALDGPFGTIQLGNTSGASNALLIGSRLSKSGNPLAVFGPQVAYWSPEILMELDMHGPGLHARGIGFPGISLYVLLGRGDGYGYSATSADGDQVDTRAVELCNPLGLPATIESTHYRRFDGQCVEIQRREDRWIAKPTAGGTGPPQQVSIITERVQLAGLPGAEGLRGGNWGIVQSRGTVGGKPVAFVRQRVTYGGEVDSALAYVEMMDPARINGAADFQRAFSRFSFTFNWFYVDDKDIAYQLGGTHPLRAPGTDPDFPVWDGASRGWPGVLSFDGTPKDKSPRKGYITSWNNKQAPGFTSSDSNWGFAPVDRVQPLNDRIEAAMRNDGKVDMVELVRAMGDAATVDLRGNKVLPFMLEVIGNAESARLQGAVDLLESWRTAGAHRRDLDGDGEYDQAAAVALMDAWWPKALDAIFRPVLGQAFDDVPYDQDDHPTDPSTLTGGPGKGSAFNDGWYGHVQKDLRTILGHDVEGPFSRQYCGSGNGVAACRLALLNSLTAALDDLASRPGHTEDPSTWDASEEAEAIQFSALGLTTIPPIPWQNRPTFQQILQFGDPKGAGGSCRGPGKGLARVVGTPASDILIGTGGDDLICGFGGPDTLRGLRGDDHLFGGRGKDVLLGGGGRDLLKGHRAADTLRGGRGKDVLGGGKGADVLRGGRGKDLLRGGKGRDGCFGGPGRDRARGCAQRRR